MNALFEISPDSPQFPQQTLKLWTCSFFFSLFTFYLLKSFSDIAGALHANPWLSIMLCLAERTPRPRMPPGDIRDAYEE
jgi:hypothetical protein